ncbi:MAG TPA: site-2 protease family protein [Candidatus Paceibacterota bacterium]|nr:site-2 protease family protein [Candidatus Paceibacterota bacterium]
MSVISFSFIFSLAVLVISVVVHEVSHGYMAYILGDPTAKMAGRLTLNPIKHIDPVGSIIVPLVLALLPGGIVFGWAKPVPYNPYNLKAGRYGPAYVALAGPLSNLFLALVFGLLIRTGVAVALLGPTVTPLLSLVVFINIMLALFNLIPVPPLDGSTILFSFLPYRSKVAQFFQRYQIIVILAVILGAGIIIDKLVTGIYYLITGI